MDTSINSLNEKPDSSQFFIISSRQALNIEFFFWSIAHSYVKVPAQLINIVKITFKKKSCTRYMAFMITTRQPTNAWRACMRFWRPNISMIWNIYPQNFGVIGLAVPSCPCIMCVAQAPGKRFLYIKHRAHRQPREGLACAFGVTISVWYEPSTHKFLE